jgi:DNA-binding NarL/FixJ family response regulator
MKNNPDKRLRTKKIRLLIVEDNRFLREGMKSLFKKQRDFIVEVALRSDEDIVQTVVASRPHVLLIDLGSRNQNNLELLKAVRECAPAAKVVVMALISTQEDAWNFIRGGVSGFVMRDAATEDLLKTIRSVASGAKVLPSLLIDSLFSQIAQKDIPAARPAPSKPPQLVGLTRRERQVIELVAAGMSNKRIAQELNLSTYTIKSHIHNILQKLAIHTRVQIARFARIALKH